MARRIGRQTDADRDRTFGEAIEGLGFNEAARLIGRRQDHGRRSADDQANGMRLARDPYVRDEEV